MNEKCIKTHVNLLHMWWGRVHEIRCHPRSAWHTVTRQCLTVMTAVLRQSRRGKHVSRSNAILADTTCVVIQSHVLKEADVMITSTSFEISTIAKGLLHKIFYNLLSEKCDDSQFFYNFNEQRCVIDECNINLATWSYTVNDTCIHFLDQCHKKTRVKRRGGLDDNQ